MGKGKYYYYIGVGGRWQLCRCVVAHRRGGEKHIHMPHIFCVSISKMRSRSSRLD
jgi:hypothetical protein